MFRSIRDFCIDNVLWINLIIVAIVFTLFCFGIYAFIEVHKDSDPDTCHTFEIIPEHEFKYILKEDGKFSTAFKLIKVELKD